MSLSTVEEVPNQSYRLRSLQERYESAKVSLALLRGLILRSDTSLFSLLGKLNSLNRPEKVFQTALSTLRGMVEQVRPEAFRHKAREGALWLFNSEEICLLEEANIIGIAPVLRDLVASHDWTRRSNRSLFSRGTEGVAVGKGEVNFGTSLESSFFEFYVNLHIFLTLAQSASVSKQIN
ncbi:hypothetical protein ADEAN_000459200 [Angomonas deanei]|uniref:Uncharacterized protein n=1 Tax=Angomonas deanei TaxID=59799 RepID=A0A7G2CE17_9TRYP|nr:hypothetical protein ADEAN_000459200 [Angomonas deanei]